MRTYDELLDVVDENDQVVGRDTRENIHKLGLLHREIWVWIANDRGEIAFQRRSPDKDTFPNMLDASVGGHVDLGMDYAATACKELEEETGIKASKDELLFVGMMRKSGHDKVTGKTNNVIRAVYFYKLKERESLVAEKGKATGFEYWAIDKLKNLSQEERAQFVPTALDEAMHLKLV